MVVLFGVWIILIATSQLVRSDKLITINDNGEASARCCDKGKCPCSSLHYAFDSIYPASSVTVNITSELVDLYGHAA